MRTRFEPSLPSFFRAPFRKVGTQTSGTSELVIPSLKSQAPSLLIAGSTRRFTEATAQDIKITYERLDELGRTLLDNDLLFNYIRSFLTDPSNINQFQHIVNRVITDALKTGQHIPGNCSRADIKTGPVPVVEVPFGRKIFEMKLAGFDVIFLKEDGVGPNPTILVPTYVIKEKGKTNEQEVKVGFDITSEGDVIFTESIEVCEGKQGLGVAFIRTGDNHMKRTNFIWVKDEEMTRKN